MCIRHRVQFWDHWLPRSVKKASSITREEVSERERERASEGDRQREREKYT